MRIAGGGAKTSCLALEDVLGRRFAHDNEHSDSDGTAQDGQQPEGPAPSHVSCKEATENGTDCLGTLAKGQSTGFGPLTGPANGPILNNAVANPVSAG